METIQINFQPPAMPVPAGYLKDSGALFALHPDSGYSYGWSCDLETLGDTRDRDDAHTRESSMVVPDRSSQCDEDRWQIQLPNDDYNVIIGYSDPSYNTDVSGCMLGDQSAATGVGSNIHGDQDGTRAGSQSLVLAGVAVEHVATVTVDDGTLTFSGEWNSASGAHCQSISYMIIEPMQPTIQINFQPPTMVVPTGYLRDSGGLYRDHGNGYSYGWSCDLEGLGDTRDRDNAGTVQSSLVVPDRSQNCDTEDWKISVPNGDYIVTVGFSDPSYATDVSGCTLQGQAAAQGSGGGVHGHADATIGAGMPTEHQVRAAVTDGFIHFDGEWQSSDGRHCQSVSYLIIESGSRSHYLHTHGTGVVSTTQTVGSQTWFEIGSAMTTYSSGLQHCASSSMVLCCYRDYCPDGQGQPPVGGSRSGDEWAPTRDEENWWVQTGTVSLHRPHPLASPLPFAVSPHATPFAESATAVIASGAATL